VNKRKAMYNKKGTIKQIKKDETIKNDKVRERNTEILADR
jgi:hypothetical protein